MKALSMQQILGAVQKKKEVKHDKYLLSDKCKIKLGARVNPVQAKSNTSCSLETSVSSTSIYNTLLLQVHLKLEITPLKKSKNK